MVTIKTKEEIDILREGGKKLASILQLVALEVKPGVSTAFLNEKAEALIAAGGIHPNAKTGEAEPDASAFLHFKPSGAPRPYPASLCVSINDEVVHGIPNEYPRILKEGDIVSLDLGLIHKGLITDHAITVGVGKISKEAEQLLEVTRKALNVGIAVAFAGKTTGDIGFAIETFVEKSKRPEKLEGKRGKIKPRGYGIVEDLAGHGVGYAVHEDPFVPNFGRPGEGARLKAGMVIAIEPMLTLGTHDVTMDDDGYTFRTADGSLAAHFEHTIAITEKGPEILTKI